MRSVIQRAEQILTDVPDIGMPVLQAGKDIGYVITGQLHQL